MKRRAISKHTLLTVIALIGFLLATVSVVEAHCMEIEPLEYQRVRVGYDGGGFSPETVVTVLDEWGIILEEGRLDVDGVFDYSHLNQAHMILADDGMGHRAEWVIGEDHHHRPKMPVIAGVFSFFGGTAWYYQRKVVRTKQDE